MRHISPPATGRFTGPGAGIYQKGGEISPTTIFFRDGNSPYGPRFSEFSRSDSGIFSFARKKKFPYKAKSSQNTYGNDREKNSPVRKHEKDVKTTVALFDMHVSVRQMLVDILQRQEGWQVLAETDSGLEAMKLLAERDYDVVILDTALRETSGLEVLRNLRRQGARTRALIYTAQRNGDIIAEAMKERPHGWVFKHDSLQELLEALKAVRRGCRYFTPMAAEFPDRARPETNAWETLTAQERTVLQLVAEGSSSKEAAGRLGLSPRTVDHHRAQVMQKLGLRDVTALTRYAMRRGLVALE
jgi:DNA-binding NarL/FixJ family response regulator